MWSHKYILVLAAIIALSSCGFEPVQRTGVAGGQLHRDAVQTVYVAPIGKRIGQQVRGNLLDIFSPLGVPSRPAYTLNVRLSSSREGLAIRKDETVTRFNFRLTADFELVDENDRRVVFKGRTQSIASYNVVDSSFATLAAEKDAQARVAREVSQEIGNRVGVFLAARPET